jgi:predicted ABC-type ATPase
MPNLYIIAGCNGAGKTTAAYTILPEMLQCIPFVNADEIARGLSPFQPEAVAIHAGRIMLQRIDELIAHAQDFSFETTLSSKSYIQTIKRVAAGGHHVPDDIVIRRHERSIYNFFNLYMPICDYWVMINNSVEPSEKIAEGKAGNININNIIIWNQIKCSIQTV